MHCGGGFFETDCGAGGVLDGGAVVLEGYAVGMGEDVGGAVDVEAGRWRGAGEEG